MRKFFMFLVVSMAIAGYCFSMSLFNRIKDAAVEGAQEAVQEDVDKVKKEAEDLKIATKNLVVESQEWYVKRKQLWDNYASADKLVDELTNRTKVTFKEKTKAQLKKLEAVKFLTQFNDPAKLAQVKGILSWQYNNLAFLYIEEFKIKTDYMDRMAALVELKGAEKTKFTKKTKKVFNDNLELLIEASSLLTEAMSIQLNMSEEDADFLKRSRAIESNISYVDWVQKFIN